MKRVKAICLHCDGNGNEPKMRSEIARGLWVITQYWKSPCVACGGSGEDRSVSIDEVENYEETTP